MQTSSFSIDVTYKERQDKDSCHSNYPPVESIRTDDAVLKPPCRSPLVIIEALKIYIEGKVVCEIGSALGDIALKMKKYAEYVLGIEIDEERAEYSKKRGLDTRKGNALDLLPLPDKIDVYYMWMDPEPTRRIFSAIGNGIVIMAGELGYGAEEAEYARGLEVKVLDEIHAEYPRSRMIELKYDEGDGDRESGVLVLLVVEK